MTIKKNKPTSKQEVKRSAYHETLIGTMGKEGMHAKRQQKLNERSDRRVAKKQARKSKMVNR